jgi:hypothetical protein
MLGEAVGRLKRAPPGERGALLDRYIKEILDTDQGKSGWSANKMPTTDGSTMYTGGAGRTVVVDPAGEVYMGDIQNPSQFTIGKGPAGPAYTPNYPSLKNVSGG